MPERQYVLRRLAGVATRGGSRRLLATVALAISFCACSATAQAAFTVHVISNRADLISGGEALTSVTLPANAQPAAVAVTLNGADITNEFALRPNGSYEGLVTGLVDGANLLQATLNGKSAQATIVNHAIGGPTIAGPQIAPWRCQNADATDPQCDAPPTYSYEYKSAVTGQLESYDPSNPPNPAEIASDDYRKRPDGPVHRPHQRPAMRIVTSTKSPCSTNRPCSGKRGRRSRSSTTSC